MICGIIMYRAWGLHNIIQTPVCIGKSDTTKEALSQAIIQLKLTDLNFQEKFDSINKRLDDYMLFGGLIITLLLGISVSVYLKTEAEVDKHFKEHFTENVKRIAEYEVKANELYGKIITYAARVERMLELSKKEPSEPQINPPNESTNS